MDFLLETNPAFLIIPINTTEFVFIILFNIEHLD